MVESLRFTVLKDSTLTLISYKLFTTIFSAYIVQHPFLCIVCMYVCMYVCLHVRSFAVALSCSSVYMFVYLWLSLMRIFINKLYNNSQQMKLKSTESKPKANLKLKQKI